MTDELLIIKMFFPLLFILSSATAYKVGDVSKNFMRAAKCVVPNGGEHTTRAILLQQCISENYAQGNETQCYDELGCFPMDSPWTTLLRPFPSPLHPAEINTRLYCYTRQSSVRFNISLWPDISLEGCPFNADRTTVFVTHGFASNGNTSWVADIKDAYLKKVDANIFLVDWGQGAELLNYLQVASNTRIAGAEVGRFVKYLQSQHGLDLSKVHLIGHSLGAHITSYAAKLVPGIQRITALDPAQPGFEGQDKSVRLDKDDARYVDVLHTNAAPFLPLLGFGLMLPTGKVDFYMNGGLRQPGCSFPDVKEIKSIGDLAKFPVEVVNTWVSCSHGRAYEYFTDVLRDNCTIWGRLGSLTKNFIDAGSLGYINELRSTVETCDAESCIPIGLESPEYEATGIFSASTPKSSPFCSDSDENLQILSQLSESSAKAITAVTEAASKAKEKVTALTRKVVGFGSSLTSKNNS